MKFLSLVCVDFVQVSERQPRTSKIMSSNTGAEKAFLTLALNPRTPSWIFTVNNYLFVPIETITNFKYKLISFNLM